METSIRMKQVHENFLMSEFDELERMTAYETEASAQKGVKSYLEGMFIDGYLATYYLLGIEVPDKLVDSSAVLNAKIGGEDYKSRISEYYSSEKDISPIVRSDGHRMFVEGQRYAANQIEASTSAVITKTWDATLDEKTRDTHWLLHGTTLNSTDYFETYNGKSQAPGLFGIPEEDCGCRCILDFQIYN